MLLPCSFFDEHPTSSTDHNSLYKLVKVRLKFWLVGNVAFFIFVVNLVRGNHSGVINVEDLDIEGCESPHKFILLSSIVFPIGVMAISMICHDGCRLMKSPT